eukprot:Em0018g54a
MSGGCPFAPGAEGQQLPAYTWEQIKEHNHSKSLWVVVHDNVYDVTKFLEEHPGGEEVMLEQAGRDATEAFEDVGHSPDAREIQKKYLIGTVSGPRKAPIQKKTQPTAPEGSSSSWLIPALLLAIVAVIVLLVYRSYD